MLEQLEGRVLLAVADSYEPNENRERAREISGGSEFSINATLHEHYPQTKATDVDHYWFIAPADVPGIDFETGFRFTFRGESDALGEYPVALATLSNSDHAGLAALQIGVVEQTSVVSQDIRAGERLYLEVLGTEWEGEYTLTLEFPSGGGDGSDDGGSGDDGSGGGSGGSGGEGSGGGGGGSGNDDHGDSTATATRVGLDAQGWARAHGEMESWKPGDSDYFSFVPRVGGKSRIRIEHTGRAVDGGALSLYDQSGNQLIEWDRWSDRGGAASTAISRELEVGQTYYVGVSIPRSVEYTLDFEPPPNLVPGAVLTDASSYVAGASIEITASVQNVGRDQLQDEGPYRVGVQLVGTREVTLFTWDHDELDSREEDVRTERIVLPGADHPVWRAGESSQYTIRVVVDALGRVAESNESDNVATRTITVQRSGPVLESLAARYGDDEVDEDRDGLPDRIGRYIVGVDLRERFLATFRGGTPDSVRFHIAGLGTRIDGSASGGWAAEFDVGDLAGPTSLTVISSFSGVETSYSVPIEAGGAWLARDGVSSHGFGTDVTARFDTSSRRYLIERRHGLFIGLDIPDDAIPMTLSDDGSAIDGLFAGRTGVEIGVVDSFNIHVSPRVRPLATWGEAYVAVETLGRELFDWSLPVHITGSVLSLSLSPKLKPNLGFLKYSGSIGLTVERHGDLARDLSDQIGYEASIEFGHSLQMSLSNLHMAPRYGPFSLDLGARLSLTAELGARWEPNNGQLTLVEKRVTNTLRLEPFVAGLIGVPFFEAGVEIAGNVGLTGTVAYVVGPGIDESSIRIDGGFAGYLVGRLWLFEERIEIFRTHIPGGEIASGPAGNADPVWSPQIVPGPNGALHSFYMQTERPDEPAYLVHQVRGASGAWERPDGRAGRLVLVDDGMAKSRLAAGVASDGSVLVVYGAANHRAVSLDQPATWADLSLYSINSLGSGYSDPVRLTDDARIDVFPSLAFEPGGDRAILAWVRLDPEAIASDGNPQLYARLWDDGEWGDEWLVSAPPGRVDTVRTMWLDGEAIVGWRATDGAGRTSLRYRLLSEGSGWESIKTAAASTGDWRITGTDVGESPSGLVIGWVESDGERSRVWSREVSRGSGEFTDPALVGEFDTIARGISVTDSVEHAPAFAVEHRHGSSSHVSVLAPGSGGYAPPLRVSRGELSNDQPAIAWAGAGTLVVLYTPQNWSHDGAIPEAPATGADRGTPLPLLSTTVSLGPDLGLSSLSLDRERAVGGEVTARVRVTNSGLAYSDTYSVRLYSGNPDAGGVEIGSEHLSGLGAGGSRVTSFDWVIDSWAWELWATVESGSDLIASNNRAVLRASFRPWHVIDPDGGISGSDTITGDINIVARGADGGDVRYFYDSASDSWLAQRLSVRFGIRDELASTPQTWQDARTGASVTALPMSEGLWLVDDATGEAESLTERIDGATPIVGSITSFVTNGGYAHVAGLNAAGRLVLYRQAEVEKRIDWVYEDLSGLLASRGRGTPAFTGELISYVTSWNQATIAGLDGDGIVQSVWRTPDEDGVWSVANLSVVTGAPKLLGGLTSFLTPWGAINIAGTDSAGRIRAVWWLPHFGGEWRLADLSRSAGAPRLDASGVSSFVTGWGAMNVVGLDSEGDLTALWWAPTTNRWQTADLSRSAGIDRPFVGRPLGIPVARRAGMALVGTSDAGSLMSAWWESGSPWTAQFVTEDAELR